MGKIRELKAEHYAAIHAEYIKWLNTLGFAKCTVTNFDRAMKDFFEWLENRNILSITQLTNKHISDYYEHMQTRPNRKYTYRAGISATQINQNTDAINKLCEFLYQNGMNNAPIPPNFRIKIDEHTRIRKLQPFTQEEIKELYGCIDLTYNNLKYETRELKQEQIRLVFALHYGCGLRMSEGQKLTIQDVDFEKKTVFVRQGKNYKDRIVPMNDGVCKIVENYIYNYRKCYKTAGNRLFINKQMSLMRGLKELQRVCDNPQIKEKRLYFHILRHSIATHLLQNGMKIENIALFLGHSTLESTQIYTHLINI